MFNRIVSYSIAPNGTIVSNNIAPNGDIFSNSIALNRNIVSNSISPIGNIVSHNIVDSPNFLLSKHISYSFPSAFIRHINGIDFTFHSNLYFDVQRWIILLLSLLQLFVSLFQPILLRQG